MAVEIVRLSQGNTNGVYFPTSDKFQNLEAAIKSKNFNRADPEAIDLLRSLKPYREGNPWLRALHETDVSNKHKFVVPTTQGVRVDRLFIHGFAELIGFEVRGVNGIGSFPTGTEYTVGTDIFPVLRFAPDQPLANGEVISTLNKLIDLSQDIVESFAALFKKRGG